MLRRFQKIILSTSLYSLLGRRNWTLVKSLYETAPKSLFWALHLCTQIWVRTMIALLKKKQNKTKTTSICQSGWKEIWNAFLGIPWVFFFVKYIRLQYTVRWNKQTNKQNNVSSTPMIKTSRKLSVYLSRNHKTVDNFARTSGNE